MIVRQSIFLKFIIRNVLFIDFILFHQQINSQLFIKNFPIEIIKLVESININFLKKKYNQQSEIFIGPYKLDLNSRSIFKQDISQHIHAAGG